MPGAKLEASIWLTRPKSGISGGVTLAHVFPKSRVTCTRPSSLPVQMMLASRLPGPTEKITPYTSGPFMSPVMGPPDFSCVSGAWRVRSPDRRNQVLPPSRVAHSRCDETKRSFGSALEKMMGKVHCHRSLISLLGSPE